MASLTVQGVRLAGVASCVPEARRGVDEIAARFGLDEAERIRQSIGVDTRAVAAAGTCASDLCHAAAVRLLNDLAWEPETISGLIFVSQSPDYFAPATACVLHERLGLPKSCAAFDMNLGCSGYVYGMSVAAQLAAGSGGRVLLLVGDTITKMVAEDDRSTLPLFGDAGSATALEPEADAGPMTFTLGTDGAGKDELIVHEGAFRNPPDEATGDPRRRCVAMNGAEVFRFALSEVPRLYRSAVASAGWSADDVQGIVMHQSNQFMLDHFRKRLKAPRDSFVIGLRRYGNTSCASIPLAINDAWGGARASIDKRLVLVGFGVGWSWGAVAVACRGTRLPPVVTLRDANPEPVAVDEAA